MRVNPERWPYQYAYYFDHPADLPPNGADVPARNLAHRIAYTTGLLALVGLFTAIAVCVCRVRRLR